MGDVRETVSIDELQKFLELDQVDAGNGMLFGTSAAKKQEPRKNALTLVIATGGSGASAIKEAIKIADQKLLPEYQNYVDFLVVDSDSDEIEGTKSKNGVRTLYTSTEGAPHRMTLKPGAEYRPEFFRKFMPADYDILKINGYGSSRDRITGKMKLYDKTKDGASTNDARFQDMIVSLFNGNGKWSAYKDKPVDIMILTGISGGNGSGTFIDLAARAKHACQVAGAAGVKVYGYIMLPDTAEGFAGADAVKQTFYQNGYAALKELESYMSIGFNGERKEVIPSTNPVEDITISPTNMLFDYPVLISGNYREAVSMIAETIVNIAGKNAGTFNQESFYSNITSARLTAMAEAQMCQSGVLKMDACPEDSHQYCGIGYAHAEIPEKIVIPNVVGKVCGSLYLEGSQDGIAGHKSVVFCSQKRKLTKAEFEDAIGILFNVGENVAVDENCLLRLIDDKLWDLSVLPENKNPLTYADVAGNQFGTWEAAFNAPALVKNGQKEMKQYLDGLYESFLQKAVTVMNQYGPRAMEYLYTGEGADKPTDFAHISIRRILEIVNDTLIDIAKTMSYHPELLPAKGVLGAFVAEKLAKEVDGWKQQKESAIQADIRQEIAEAMYGNNGMWIAEYQSKVEQFIRSCIRFANVLELMTTYYSSVGKSVDAGSFAGFTQAQTENNGINLCSDQTMYDWVKSCISQKVTNINVAQLKQMLINDFMEHSDKWCSDEKGVARARYDEIMSIACQLGANATANNGLNLTIKDYFDAALFNVPVSNQTQKINAIVGGIMARLMQKSKPSLRIRNGAFCDNINKNVMVPQSLILGNYGTQILNSFNAHLGSQVNDNNQVIVSPVVDSIVSYQTSVANAISDLADLPKWELAYESQKSNTKHLNCGEYVSQYTELSMSKKDELDHVVRKGRLDPEDELLGTTGLSWEHYPSINTVAFQNSFTQFNELAGKTIEAQYRQNVFEKKIEYALNEKIIECVEVSPNVYQYWVNLIPADWNNLNVNAWNDREKGRCVRGKDLFDFLHNQNKHSYAAYRKRIVLTGSQIFDGPGFDFNTIIQLQHWNELRVEQEHQNYMKRIMRKNTALYMELEETLYRYYDIRKALEAKEKGYQAYVLTELYLFGCIVVDEDEEQWDVRIDPDGGIRNIITLDWLTRMTGLDAFETGLCEDGLIWPIVYNRFKALGLKMEELDQVRLSYVKKVGQQDPQGFRQMVEGRMGKLQKAYEAYHAAFGSKADPAAEIAKKYSLGANDAETVADMVQVYQSMLEALAKNRKMFGGK